LAYFVSFAVAYAYASAEPPPPNDPNNAIIPFSPKGHSLDRASY